MYTNVTKVLESDQLEHTRVRAGGNIIDYHAIVNKFDIRFSLVRRNFLFLFFFTFARTASVGEQAACTRLRRFATTVYPCKSYICGKVTYTCIYMYRDTRIIDLARLPTVLCRPRLPDHLIVFPLCLANICISFRCIYPPKSHVRSKGDEGRTLPAMLVTLGSVLHYPYETAILIN